MIAFRDLSPGTGGLHTVTINVPTATADGDVMLVFIAADLLTPVISDPAGWTLIGQQDWSTTITVRALLRVAHMEPASYTWTSASGNLNGTIASYLGVNVVTPQDATAIANGVGLSFNFNSSAITPVTNNAVVVSGVGASGGTITVFPDNMRGRNLGGASPAVGIADVEVNPAASFSPLFFRSDTQPDWVGWSIALRPSVGLASDHPVGAN